MSANFNFNKVILGGRLTADPEVKTSTSGLPVVSFSVAVNRKGKEQITDFYNVTAWRQTAELVGRFFRKGSTICIVGTIQNRSWTDNQGVKRYATDIIADEVSFVDSKNAAQGDEEVTPTNYIPDAYKGSQTENIEPTDDLPF